MVLAMGYPPWAARVQCLQVTVVWSVSSYTFTSTQLPSCHADGWTSQLACLPYVHAAPVQHPTVCHLHSLLIARQISVVLPATFGAP